MSPMEKLNIRIEELFKECRKFDIYQQNTISLYNFKKAMSNIGLGSREREEALKSADVTAHGTLDYKQFYNKVRVSS